MSTSTAPSTDALRSEVSRAYAVALEKSQAQQGGCCGGSTCGVAAQTAGYDEEIALHGEAAASSFGCGNPLAFAGVEAGQTVVDLGSGAGFDLLIAAEKVGPSGKVIGVDMTPEMLAAARANAEKAGATQVEVREGLIEKLPVDDASADWVISNCVINLSPEKERVFAEIARVLKPGGRFSISDIVAEDLPGAIREHAAAYAACIAGAISESEYLDGLRRAGLAEVEVSDRHVYSAAELRGIVESDLDSFNLPKDTFGDVYKRLEGQVWSARIVGRKGA